MAFEDLYIDNQFTHYLEAIRAGLVLRRVNPAVIDTCMTVLTALIPTLAEIHLGAGGGRDAILRYTDRIGQRFPDSADKTNYLTYLGEAIAITSMDTDQAKQLISDGEFYIREVAIDVTRTR